VLLGILIPVLAGTRASRLAAKRFSLLRQHGAIVLSYTTDFREQLPYFADKALERSIVRSKVADYQVDIPYFEAGGHWHIALNDGYYNGPLSPELFVSPDSHPAFLAEAVAYATSYKLTCTSFAVPEYWNPSTRLTDDSQLASVRTSLARQPSKKGLLRVTIIRDVPAAELGTLADLFLLDGSALSGAASSILYADPVGYSSGDGMPMRGHLDASPRIMHTIDGIAGRDLR